MTHDPLTWDNLFGADPNYVNMPSDYEQGQRDMLLKCIDALEQMLDVDPCDCDRCRAYTTAQAILRALQEKP